MALFSNLGNYKNFGLLVIRTGLGLTFIYYGYPILTGGPDKWKALGESTRYVGIHFLPVIWGLMAALVETVGGILLIIGLAFRPVCLLLMTTLIVAIYSHFGRGQGLGDAEHAIEDAIIFAGLLFVGPGKYSMDKK